LSLDNSDIPESKQDGFVGFSRDSSAQGDTVSTSDSKLLTVIFVVVATFGGVVILAAVFWRRRECKKHFKGSDNRSMVAPLAESSPCSPTASNVSSAAEADLGQSAEMKKLRVTPRAPEQRLADETQPENLNWLHLTAEMKGRQSFDDESLQFMEQIGSGGYGVVYKGLWQGLPVAIKTVMFQDLGGQDTKQRKRAVYEAAISSSVVHCNVVQTYSYFFRRLTPDTGEPVSDHSCVDWKLHIVQEFCQLGSLLRSLKRGQFVDLSSHAPNMDAIVEVALQVARGMQHIHRHNIVHGDLTTRNVLLQHDSSGLQRTPIAKVSDFGLSVKLDRCQNHISNHRAGTPLYMAPEVGLHGRLSKASDVYSFGIILWELFHLSLPAPVSFSKVVACRKGPPRFSRICPMPYALLCAVCLSPHPSDRPDFDQLVEILERQLIMIQSGRLPKRMGVEALNAEWAKGIVGLRPQEALTFMLFNLPKTEADSSMLSTVSEDGGVEKVQTTSTLDSEGSSQPTASGTRPLLAQVERKEVFYRPEHAFSSTSASKSEDVQGLHLDLEGESPPQQTDRGRQPLGNQISLVGAGNEDRAVLRRTVSCGSNIGSSFDSQVSVTVEPSESCEDAFMSLGWAANITDGHVDRGLNPLGLLAYRSVASCSCSTATYDWVTASQPGSREEEQQNSRPRACLHSLGHNTDGSNYFSL